MKSESSAARRRRKSSTGVSMSSAYNAGAMRTYLDNAGYDEDEDDTTSTNSDQTNNNNLQQGNGGVPKQIGTTNLSNNLTSNGYHSDTPTVQKL